MSDVAVGTSDEEFEKSVLEMVSAGKTDPYSSQLLIE